MGLKKNKNLLPSLIFFLFSNFLPPAIHAAELDLLSGDIFDFELGPGYGGGQNYRANGSKRRYQNGYGHGIIPFYYLRLGPIYVSDVYSLEAFSHSDKKASLRLGGLITFAGEPYQAGAIKRVESFFGGGFIGFGPVTIYGITDMMSKSNGTIYGIRFSPLLIKTNRGGWYLDIEGERWNRLFNNYYFGIHETEANETLTVYTPGADFKASVALVYSDQISNSWRFIAWVKENYYGDKIYASPTVGRQYQFQAALGWLYKFF